MENNFITKFILKGIEEDIEEDIKTKTIYTMKKSNIKELMKKEQVIKDLYKTCKKITYFSILKYISFINKNKLIKLELKTIENLNQKQLQKNLEKIEKTINNNNYSNYLDNILKYSFLAFNKYEDLKAIENDIRLYIEEEEEEEEEKKASFIYENEEDIQERLKDWKYKNKKEQVITTDSSKIGYKLKIDTSAIEKFEDFTQDIILYTLENYNKNNCFYSRKTKTIRFTYSLLNELEKIIFRKLKHIVTSQKRIVNTSEEKNEFLLNKYSYDNYNIKDLFIKNKYKININDMIKSLKLNTIQLEILSYKINNTTFENIASILNKSVSSVKMCYYRLLEKIQKYLQVNYNIAI